MLERQHLTVREYNKDQKAYASMLNKMYVAAKEGEWMFDSGKTVGNKIDLAVLLDQEKRCDRSVISANINFILLRNFDRI